ncbi:uncharacterized protein LOC110861065 [Folsomia candida]|uniref:uncharacterized protein LOC110861065 n=1 Tax=Folsomia candida TaxID=158441 RepID=UPI001604F908|nr:uncharacterized protein LOC110861065 [Folsomia candida]
MLPIKIGDFGQCRTLLNNDNHTLTKSSIGTRVYRAPEVLSGKYSYQSDLFSLGLIIWEVVDLINESEISSLFDRLISDRATQLVKQEHPLIGKIGFELVVNLVKRNITERYKTMEDVEKIIDNWKSVQIMDKAVTCRTGEDLELCLSFPSQNCIILLEEGDFQGHFIVSHDNVRILGQGVHKTRIKSSFSFDICGNDCSISNLSISPTNTLDFSLNIKGSRNRLESIIARGINVSGNECTLTNINVHNVVRGIQICGSHNHIYYVNFTNIADQYIALGDNSENCTVSGMSIKDSGKFVLERGTSRRVVTDDINNPNQRGESIAEASKDTSDLFKNIDAKISELHKTAIVKYRNGFKERQIHAQSEEELKKTHETVSSIVLDEFEHSFVEIGDMQRFRQQKVALQSELQDLHRKYLNDFLARDAKTRHEINKILENYKTQVQSGLDPFYCVSDSKLKALHELAFSEALKQYQKSIQVTKSSNSNNNLYDNLLRRKLDETFKLFESENIAKNTIAGLNVIGILNEPAAAAIAYGLNYTDDESRNILVYDLGGGVFDVSVLTVKECDINVRAVGGDNHLGGEDFDTNMLTHCVQEFQKAHNIQLDKVGNERDRNSRLRRIRAKCEKAKISLSSSQTIIISIDRIYEDYHLQVEITRRKFNELNEHLFKKTITIVTKALEDAKMEAEAIDDIVLVGVSTKIPRVREILQVYFKGKKFHFAINPKEVVARGAAIVAAMKSAENLKEPGKI